LCFHNVNPGTVTITLKEDGSVSSHATMESGLKGETQAEDGTYWREVGTSHTEIPSHTSPVAIPNVGGDLTLLFAAPGAGTLRASATRQKGASSSARRHPRSLTLAKGKKRVRAAGLVKLRLTPTKAARAVVSRKKAIRVSVKLDFAAAQGGHTKETVTAYLGVPKRKAKAGKHR
jgi:hypothetical protein